MEFRAVFPDASAENRARLSACEFPGDFTLDVHLAPVPDREAFFGRVGDARGVLLGWYAMDAALLDALPALEVISFLGVGVSDYVDLAAARERGITVCNTPGYGDDAVAEHAVGLMLAVARHIPRLHAEVRDGGFGREPIGLQMKGRALGLVGFGGIARAVARIAAGLGMRVIAWTRDTAAHAAEAAALGVEFVDLPRLFTDTDVVSVHLPLTDQTDGLIGPDLLTRMKRTAILVNTARGRVVDHDTLEQMLVDGHLYGAGLDVFPEEPCPDRPLLHLPNVVLTPHVAYYTADALERLLAMGVENLLAFHAGRPVNVLTT